MFAEASTFGDGLLNILILTTVAGILYRRWFPKNEPGELIKGGIVDAIKRRLGK